MTSVTPTRMLMEAERLLHKNLSENREIRQIGQTVGDAAVNAELAALEQQDTIAQIDQWAQFGGAAGAQVAALEQQGTIPQIDEWNKFGGTQLNDFGEKKLLSNAVHAYQAVLKVAPRPDPEEELKLLKQAQGAASRLADAAKDQTRKLLKG